MPSNKLWKQICLTGLTVLFSALLVACGNQPNDKAKTETHVAKEKKTDEEIFFKEKPVQIDYTKAPEEILANYTEKGMNDFKVNFPDTLSMNYALKNIGKKAPEITGKTIDGKDIKLSALKGKNVLISFSKTTCSVCKEMSPIIKQVSDANKDIVFINVYPVDNNDAIKTYYKELKEPVPANTLSLEMNKNLKDLAVNSYQIDQVPTYVFVDSTGKISYTYIGNKDKIMFQDMIKTAFGKEKLYDNVRTVTVRVDKNGKEIVDDKLVDEKKINADSVDHTQTDVTKAKQEKAEEQKKAETKKATDKTAKKETVKEDTKSAK